MPSSATDVVFAVLPFAEVNRPAIGVSLLKSQIARFGFHSRVEYLNLRFAELAGLSLYVKVVNQFAPIILLGEWFFADCVFAEGLPPGEDYIERLLARYCGTDTSVVEEVIHARQLRKKYLDECVHRILESNPRVVGFTTTFNQTCACLAVAKRLKATSHPPVIVFGGGNCAGEMGQEMIRSFPWIDYVCSGEGDLCFPALLRHPRMESGEASVAGILNRAQAAGPITADPVCDLDALRLPDYDEYFEQTKASPLDSQLTKGLPVETSRGCWWGAKHRCLFCGLNDETIPYRSKSPRRAFDTIVTLTGRCGLTQLQFSDNILDPRYIDQVFPLLAGRGLELFYEVKANLRYEQLRVLRAGGACGIQPGIESLSDEVLRLMNKGCTAAQNIQLLRWCEELGLEVAWNLLAGIPGESPAEYERMAGLVPLITHLQPPTGCAPIRLDRFSPLFANPERFGIGGLRPPPAYYYTFPLGRRELFRLAYYFDFDYTDGRDPWSYTQVLRNEIFHWTEQKLSGAERRPKLDALFQNGAIRITDTREIATAQTRILTGLAARVYLACDRASSFEHLAQEIGFAAGEAALRAVLNDLCDTKLMLETGGRFLSLAVFRNRPEIQETETTYDRDVLRQTTSAEELLRVV